eukprot:1141507-Pelagomonas_calceolata.AAC.7
MFALHLLLSQGDDSGMKVLRREACIPVLRIARVESFESVFLGIGIMWHLLRPSAPFGDPVHEPQEALTLAKDLGLSRCLAHSGGTVNEVVQS